MTETPQQIIGRMMDDIHRSSMEQARQEAKTNPSKFSRSTIMEGNANWCYFNGGWIKRVRTLEHHQFCRTTHKNIGGCFLIFELVHTFTPGGKWRKSERGKVTPVDSLREARELTLKRRDRWREANPGFDEYKPKKRRG